MEQIALKCCTCGKTEPVTVEHKPECSFEFYKIVQDAKWTPVLDLNFGRTLCFCSLECRDMQMTKKGYIRKHLIKKERKAMANG